MVYVIRHKRTGFVFLRTEDPAQICEFVQFVSGTAYQGKLTLIASK